MVTVAAALERLWNAFIGMLEKEGFKIVLLVLIAAIFFIGYYQMASEAREAALETKRDYKVLLGRVDTLSYKLVSCMSEKILLYDSNLKLQAQSEQNRDQIETMQIEIDLLKMQLKSRMGSK